MTDNAPRGAVSSRVVACGWTLTIAALASWSIEWVAAAFSTVPYSFLDQTVSDLGATTCGPLDYVDPPVEVCSPAYAWVNGVWIVGGLTIAVTVLLLRDRLTRDRRRTGMSAAFVLAAAGVLQAAVGFVPLDVNLALHTIVALVGFLAQNAGLVLAGIALAGRRRVLSLAATVGGVIGLVAPLLLLAPSAWNLPIGLVERVALYPFLMWLAAAGVVWAGRGPSG